jgi:hypothetical protein
MPKIKKTLRLLGFAVLIALASLGVGIAGAAPTPMTKKRENTIEIKIELVEKDKKSQKILKKVEDANKN